MPEDLKSLLFLDRGKMESVLLQPGISDDLKMIREEMGIDSEKPVDFFLLLDNIFAEQVRLLQLCPMSGPYPAS